MPPESPGAFLSPNGSLAVRFLREQRADASLRFPAHRGGEEGPFVEHPDGPQGGVGHENDRVAAGGKRTQREGDRRIRTESDGKNAYSAAGSEPRRGRKPCADGGGGDGAKLRKGGEDDESAGHGEGYRPRRKPRYRGGSDARGGDQRTDGGAAEAKQYGALPCAFPLKPEKGKGEPTSVERKDGKEIDDAERKVEKREFGRANGADK